VSSQELGRARHSTVDTVAGFLAAFAIALSMLAIVERPARLGPVAILLALLAARMSARRERLSLLATVIAMSGFAIGMALAVMTENPLY
jgi:hypothetical protein